MFNDMNSGIYLFHCFFKSKFIEWSYNNSLTPVSWTTQYLGPSGRVNIYTFVQKIGVVRIIILNGFEKSLLFSPQGCIYLIKKSTVNSNIVNITI